MVTDLRVASFMQPLVRQLRFNSIIFCLGVDCAHPPPWTCLQMFRFRTAAMVGRSGYAVYMIR